MRYKVLKLKKESVFYSDSFKRKVLTAIRDGEMSAFQASRHFGIKGSMTVYRWIDHQDEIFGTTFAETSSNMAEKKESSAEALTKELPEASHAELKAELASVKKLLDFERLRSESYLTMIKLAEEKFGVPIEKKFGTKQSK